MYDYVIVGGGSAGCVLASRLSEDPAVTVCLLEAGPPDRHPLIHMPLGILWMMRSKVLNWNFHTEPEAQLNKRKLFWPRGRTLGGSSSSNAMCYTRGHAADYDSWAAQGNAGWSYQALLPYFKRSQHQERGASAYHGTGGPLNVMDARSLSPLSPVFVKAAVAAGFTESHDFNGAEQEGVGYYQLTQKDGRRCSVAKGYLGHAKGRSNLTIITDAHATRVVFDGKRAVGVQYRCKGKTCQVAARREVLLSAGAIQSPQLLLLSGVGEAGQLQRFGIPLVHELPGVGKNLQDHLDVIIVDSCTKPLSYGITPKNLLLGLPNLLRYLFARNGMLTTNGAEAGGFIKSDPAEPIPDLQLHFTPGRLRDHGRDLKFLIGEGYSLHVCQLRPKSVGEITLASADPMAKPAIHANYLSHPDDMAAMVKGVRLARKVLAAAPFDAYRGEELVPGKAVSDDEAQIREFIRAKAETIYHPVGTCKMGSGPMAVVDAELRVHGLEGLRVVDASIMPTLIGGNTNAPTVAIAEKAVDLIRAAHETSAAASAQPVKAVLTPA
ncbi:GMC family oxidoreductase [Chitinimonas sp.]|uniref:GMC family oxidoreductase n=1 Tax=Chitinimonas sp. TaxID=1934313 RepID=UPI0035B43AD6